MTFDERKVYGTFIQVARGMTFDYKDMNVSRFTVDDYAFAIAKQNRFTGWTYFPYSVAQHSVLLADICPEQSLKYPCLMHDIHESLVNDISRPLKNELSGYRKMEKKVEKLVHNQLNLHIPKKVYYYDLRILVDEKAQLLPECEKSWMGKYQPLGVKIEEWTWRKAYKEFMKKYEELKP